MTPYVPSVILDGRAESLWRDYRLSPGFDIEELIDGLGLSLLWASIVESDGETILGALDPTRHLVVLNEQHLRLLEENLGLRRFTLAHEIGHWLLHSEAARSGTIPLDSQGRIWCRSGAGPIERQAEMFAGRLLVPRDLLVRDVAGVWSGWGPVYSAAQHFETTVTAMMVRLEELELAHRDRSGIPRAGKVVPEGQGVLFPSWVSAGGSMDPS